MNARARNEREGRTAERVRLTMQDEIKEENNREEGSHGGERRYRRKESEAKEEFKRIKKKVVALFHSRA